MQFANNDFVSITVHVVDDVVVVVVVFCWWCFGDGGGGGGAGGAGGGSGGEQIESHRADEGKRSRSCTLVPRSPGNYWYDDK